MKEMQREVWSKAYRYKALWRRNRSYCLNETYSIQYNDSWTYRVSIIWITAHALQWLRWNGTFQPGLPQEAKSRDCNDQGAHIFMGRYSGKWKLEPEVWWRGEGGGGWPTGYTDGLRRWASSRIWGSNARGQHAFEWYCVGTERRTGTVCGRRMRRPE